MPKSDVALLSTDQHGIFELRLQLNLTEEPLASYYAQMMFDLESTRRALTDAHARISELEARAQTIDNARPQTPVPTPASARPELETLAEARARVRAELVAQAAAAETEAVALKWAEAQFARSFAAAPSAVGTSAMCATAGLQAMAPPARPSRANGGGVHKPVAGVAQRITDTLSDLEMSLGAAQAVSAAVDRLLCYFGVWRSAEWDDRDELRGTSSFAPILPWYRRSGLLLLFIAITITVFVAVGGLSWTASKLTSDATRVVAVPAADARVVGAAPVPETAHVNMLAGTPFEKKSRKR
jgi:hypothetical protein